MRAEPGREPEKRDRILDIADRLAQHREAAAEREERAGWISFSLAGARFALPVTHVRGVHRAGHITPLPKAPAAVRGLTNLRGRITAVIDLAAQLDLGTTAIDERSRILEAEIGRRRLGLLTERTDSLLRIRPGEVEPVGPATAAAMGARAAGEIETKTGRVVLLDPVNLLEGAGMAAGRGTVRPDEKR